MSQASKRLRASGVAAAVFGMAALLGGCASAPRSGETLIESVRTYNDGIRWQRFSAAAGRLPAAERSAFVDEWDERAEDIKVADYEIVDLAARGDVAVVQVKISWYGEREGTLHDTHARQMWRRAGKIWLLTDEVRMRGAAMPGLAEPPPKPAAEDAAAGDDPGADATEAPAGAAADDEAVARGEARSLGETPPARTAKGD